MKKKTTRKKPNVYKTPKGKRVAKKWIKTESDKQAVKQGYYFDKERAAHVCDFFEECLVLSKGEFAGKPFKLLPWERNDLLSPLFGWVHETTKVRRFNIGYVQIAKKNGKSALCSGVSVYLTLADSEQGAEVYNAAADRDQASIVYSESVNMIKASPELSQILRITDSKKRIDWPDTNSFVRVISSEAYTAEGLNIHGLIFDELHAQKKRDLWDALRYGGAARRQPLILAITTAGWDTSSICYEQYDYAKKILSGDIVDVNFFPLIYEASKKDNFLNPRTWEKANPSIGITVSFKGMEQAALEAKQSPSKLNTFLRYRLDIWTEQKNRWFTGEQWKACTRLKDKDDPFEWRMKAIEQLCNSRCIGAFDLGSNDDLSAMVYYFPDDKILLPWVWCPEESLKNKKNPNRPLYVKWKAQGWLETTEGNVTDYDVIRTDIKDKGGLFRIEEIAFDPWQAAQLSTQLMSDGFEMIEFRQGFGSMAAPCKEFERLVLAGELEHGNNPVLINHASNASVKTDPAGNIKPFKPERNSPYKIDAIVACVMAIGRAMVQEEESSVCNVTVID